jgi:tRNA 2-thiouridine synthesizing protein A
VRLAASLDARALACPLSWVKTRIALERLAAGDLLEVWLGDGEPARSVPVTAAEEGHRVVSLEPPPAAGAGAWRLLLQKGTPPASPGPGLAP